MKNNELYYTEISTDCNLQFITYGFPLRRRVLELTTRRSILTPLVIVRTTRAPIALMLKVARIRLRLVEG